MHFSAEGPSPFVEAVQSSVVAQSLSAGVVNCIFEVLPPSDVAVNFFVVGLFDIGPQHLLSQSAKIDQLLIIENCVLYTWICSSS